MNNLMEAFNTFEDILQVEVDLPNAVTELNDALLKLQEEIMRASLKKAIDEHFHNIDTAEKLKARISNWHDFVTICGEFVPVYGTIRNVELWDDKLTFYAEEYSSSAQRDLTDSFTYQGEEQIKKFLSDYKKHYEDLSSKQALDEDYSKEFTK